MIIPLIAALVHDAHLLQEVVRIRCATNGMLLVEEDLHILPEPRRVVVANRLGIAERLQDWIRQENAILDVRGGTGNLGEVLEALLRALRFTCNSNHQKQESVPVTQKRRFDAATWSDL